MKIGDNVVLRGTIKGVIYGEYGFPHYLVTLPNGCETKFPKPYIEDLQQLDEPQKVKIPQFVAEYIEFKKENNFHVYGAMRTIKNYEDKRVPNWFYEGNIEKFCLAWILGYEVEEELKYTVKIKGVNGYNTHLNKYLDSQNWFFASKSEVDGYRVKHTRKELEEAGFSWVFDCPGIEIEEVTE